MSDPTNSNDDRPDHAPSTGLISSGSAPDASRVGRAWEQRPDEHSADPGPAASDSASDSGPPVGSPGVATPTIVLDSIEARVLGSMIEKSFLTPDIYPMTTNALVTACNQKTNREPVVDYDATTVDGALLEMRQRSLVRRVHTPGSRSTKHRQTLDEVLELVKAELALLSVLLLRGPQTVGELRLRTERHDVGFDDLETVEATLDRLAGRATPLVEMLDRQPGHKENRWRHLLHDPDEAEASVSSPVSELAPSIPAAPTAVTPNLSTATVPPAHGSSAESPARPVDPDAAAGSAPSASAMSERIAALEVEVARLRAQLERLASALGETLS